LSLLLLVADKSSCTTALRVLELTLREYAA
jgi:hypothetical protein